jgi:hypothetical protein
MVGDNHLISSTLVSSFMELMIIRAYVERLSRYLLCHSVYMVSKASEDFPDPETPVITTSLFLGISMEIFFRL